TIILQPMDNWHLYSDFKDGRVSGGRIRFVWLFSIIGVFVLLLACINFMNMSTARSEKRAKEVGIRKVVGAQKKSLIGQFLSESIFISLIAGVVALMIVQLCLPSFNMLTGKQLTIEYNNIYFWLYFIGFIFFTGIIAG